MQQAVSASVFLAYNPDMGDKLSQLIDLHHVYLLEKD
jgi:hypothetical protein